MASIDVGNIHIEDNTEKFLALFRAAKLRGMNKVGMQAEKYAKQLCPVDTGRLRNSITHEVDGDANAYIGSNVEYAKYVECGTGSKAITGGNPLISGMAARPFLKPAATEHSDTYRALLEAEFKKI